MAPALCLARIVCHPPRRISTPAPEARLSRSPRDTLACRAPHLPPPSSLRSVALLHSCWPLAGSAPAGAPWEMLHELHSDPAQSRQLGKQGLEEAASYCSAMKGWVGRRRPAANSHSNGRWQQWTVTVVARAYTRCRHFLKHWTNNSLNLCTLSILILQVRKQSLRAGRVLRRVSGGAGVPPPVSQHRPH